MALFYSTKRDLLIIYKTFIRLDLDQADILHDKAISDFLNEKIKKV